jgi:hypothetical protein
VLGVVLACRGYRLAVETRSNALTVRGMLRTRVIPRAAISEVTDYPAVVWTKCAEEEAMDPGARIPHSPAGVARRCRAPLRMREATASMGPPPLSP